MSEIITFLNGWKEAIISAYTPYPWIAAIVIIFLFWFGIFIYKNGFKIKGKDYFRNNIITTPFFTLLLFLIISPILGLIISIIQKIIDISIYFFKFIGYFYGLYDNMPILTLVSIGVSVLLFFIIPYINYFKKYKIFTNKLFRGFSLLSFVIVFLSLINPFIKDNENSNNIKIEKKEEQTENINTIKEKQVENTITGTNTN